MSLLVTAAQPPGRFEAALPPRPGVRALWPCPRPCRARVSRQRDHRALCWRPVNCSAASS